MVGVIVLVTATNSPYYESLLTLISGVHKFSVDIVDKIFVYNLGLDESETEWHSIRNRTIQSIEYRRKNGLCLGNPPFGFTSVDKKLIKNDW